MSKEEIIEYVKKHKSFKKIEEELLNFNEKDLIDIYDEAIKVDCHLVKYIPKAILIKNASLMIKAVKQDLRLLRYIPKEALEKHPSICLKAVARYPRLLGYVPDNIKIEKPEICIDAVSKDIYCMQSVPDIVKIKHPKFCFDILEKQNFEIENIPVEVLKRDPDFVYNLLRKSNHIPYRAIPQELNEQFQEKCIELAYENIECFNMLTNENKKENIELCILAAKSGKFTLKDFPEEILKGNPEICGELAKTGKFKPERFPEEILKDNPHIYIDCAKKNVDFFRYIPKEVMYANEKEIIEMVKSDLCIYKEVPKEILLRHPEIYKMILKKLDAIHVELKSIPIEIQEKYPKECIRILEDFVGHYIDNVLAISSKILIDNPEVCIDIIRNLDYELDGNLDHELDWYLRHYHYSCGDKEIKDEFNIFDILPKELFEDIDFVKKILEINEKIFFNCSSEIKNQLLNKEDEPIGIEWQNECLEEIHNQSNVILSAPTGSGKTKVFLQWGFAKKRKTYLYNSANKSIIKSKV